VTQVWISQYFSLLAKLDVYIVVRGLLEKHTLGSLGSLFPHYDTAC